MAMSVLLLLLAATNFVFVYVCALWAHVGVVMHARLCASLEVFKHINVSITAAS